MLYRVEEGCLKELNNLNFVLEKDLQKFVEKNMDTLIGYRFLETEFVANNYRFDSVAFDEDNNAFVIVEYKRGRNESLVDQGYAYLKTIIDRKADFVLLYNEKLERNRKIIDFDWSQTRVVFVSPKFTQYQIDATSFDDMPFELFEIKKYESDLYEIERINQRNSTLKRNQVEKFESDTIKKVNSEIKPYDESYHLNRASEIAKELYLEIKERILDLDCDFSVVYTKWYVAFKKNSTKNVVDIWLKKDWLEIVFALKQGELIDSQNLTYDITNRQWSSEQYAMRVDKNVDISYVLELIRQTYSKK